MIVSAVERTIPTGATHTARFFNPNQIDTMYYILKLPGTIATIVDYPTAIGYEDVNQASLHCCRINKTEGYSGVVSEPIPEPKAA